MRFTALIVLLVTAAACGLSVVGTDANVAPGVDGGPGSGADVQVIDGSTSGDGGTTLSDGAPSDSAVGDAALDGGPCTTLIDDTFDAEDSRWDKLGDAVFQTGQVRLTTLNSGGLAGAIWWKAQLTFTGSLNVIVDMSVDSTGVNPGDGVAIGWVTTAYSLGNEGQNFGLCNAGITGVAVAADTRDSQLLLMDGISGNCSTNGGVFSGTFVNDMVLTAAIRTTGLTASVSGINGVRTMTIPQTGWLGLTASTGGSESAHTIKSVKVTSCL